MQGKTSSKTKNSTDEYIRDAGKYDCYTPLPPSRGDLSDPPLRGVGGCSENYISLLNMPVPMPVLMLLKLLAFFLRPDDIHDLICYQC